VPILSDIPYVGEFFIYGVAGGDERIDSSGNVFVNGKYQGNIYGDKNTQSSSQQKTETDVRKK
jgi:hypothetical protein